LEAPQGRFAIDREAAKQLLQSKEQLEAKQRSIAADLARIEAQQTASAEQRKSIEGPTQRNRETRTETDNIRCR
jgi:hypothetical protein